MKKMIYEVEVHVEGQSVRYSTCECPIGRDKCHHMAALLIWVEKNVSRTDVECSWKRAKTSKTDEIAAKRVSEMTPSTTRAGIKRPVTQEDKKWALASLSKLGRFTGMGWILSPEPPQMMRSSRSRQQQLGKQRTLYGRHFARNGSRQATLVWSWQQSSGSLTPLPYSKPCLAITMSKTVLKRVIGESFMSQGQSSSTQSALVSISRRGECSCLIAACLVDLQTGQYLVIALLRSLL
ncbi:uncharacterized protein LOC134335455 isoform X3 [Trichomycterus rosablanca]|uniref:uncharacterized protein LOC134335455 isoform X3 n=1 Tax=Trichomycterus rosablanca TaxID=2290929 RepID=UPI002F35E2B3